MRETIGFLGVLVLISQFGSFAHAAINSEGQKPSSDDGVAGSLPMPADEEQAPVQKEAKIQSLPRMETVAHAVAISKCSIEEVRVDGKTLYQVKNHAEVRATATNLQEAQSLAGTDAQCRR